MTEFRIREARVEDAPVLARLRLRFKLEDDESATTEPPGFVADCERWLRDRLAGGRWLVWVADRGGEVSGHVFVNRVETVPNPSSDTTELGYVTNFYVRPDHRGRGLGRALLDAVEEYSRANNFNTLIVWPSERSAALYQRAGYAHPAELLELPIAAS